MFGVHTQPHGCVYVSRGGNVGNRSIAQYCEYSVKNIHNSVCVLTNAQGTRHRKWVGGGKGGDGGPREARPKDGTAVRSKDGHEAAVTLCPGVKTKGQGWPGGVSAGLRLLGRAFQDGAASVPPPPAWEARDRMWQNGERDS